MNIIYEIHRFIWDHWVCSTKVLMPLTKDQVIRVQPRALPTEAVVNLQSPFISVPPRGATLWTSTSLRRCTSNFTKLHLVASAHCAWISSCWETEKCSVIFKSGPLHKGWLLSAPQTSDTLTGVLRKGWHWGLFSQAAVLSLPLSDTNISQ